MNLQAMTAEKLQFLLPVVFTVGPDNNSRGINAPKVTAEERERLLLENPTDGGDALIKYAMLLANSGNKNARNQNGRDSHIDDIIKGIIEGETRVLISSMSMEEIFTGE